VQVGARCVEIRAIERTDWRALSRTAQERHTEELASDSLIDRGCPVLACV
jgi:hypothetical protein